jgi:DNA-binding NarL/FixJ family response regulator
VRPSPLPIVVACSLPDVRRAIEKVLSNDWRVRLSTARRIENLHGIEANRKERIAVLLGIDELRRLSADQAIRLSRRSAITVIATRDDLLVLPGYETLSDSWLFVEDQIPNSAEIALLSLSRFCLIPPFLTPGFSVSNLRKKLVEGLNASELGILRALGEGAGNREIAANHAISETTVKYLVRSVLTKLYLENRTSAAVFVHAVLDSEKIQPIDWLHNGNTE